VWSCARGSAGTHIRAAAAAGQDLHGTAGERSPAYMPNGWPGGLPFIPSSPMYARQKKFLTDSPTAAGKRGRAATARTQTGLGQPGAVAGGVIREMFDEGRRPGMGRDRSAGRSGGWPSSTELLIIQQMAEDAEHPTDLVVDFIHCGASMCGRRRGPFSPPGIEQIAGREGAAGNSARKASLGRGGMRRSRHAPGDGRGRAEAVGRLCDYLLKLRADHCSVTTKARTEGVPIGTGVIKKRLSSSGQRDRMNLTGARWSVTGAR